MKILRQVNFSNKEENKKSKSSEEPEGLIPGIIIGGGAGATGTALGMSIGTGKIARDRFKELRNSNKQLPKRYLDLYGNTPQARIALREDARKAAIAHRLSKRAAIGFGASTALGTAGYAAYKHYKNKKKESDKKDKD